MDITQPVAESVWSLSHIWGWWRLSLVSLCPVCSITLSLLLSLQKTWLYKDRLLEVETGLSVLYWYISPELWQSFSFLKHTFTAVIKPCFSRFLVFQLSSFPFFGRVKLLCCIDGSFKEALQRVRQRIWSFCKLKYPEIKKITLYQTTQSMNFRKMVCWGDFWKGRIALTFHPHCASFSGLLWVTCFNVWLLGRQFVVVCVSKCIL